MRTDDLRLAWRMAIRAPGFTLAVVAVLTIGIAATTIVASAARSLFLRPLPFPDADRLMFVSRAYPGFPQGGGNFSYPAYQDMLRQQTSFDVLAAYQDFGALAITDAGEAVRVRVCYATPSYLELLGFSPVAGRTLRHDEDRFGDADAVVVLSYGLWQRRYGGASDIVGRTLHFNGQPLTVVGVAPAAFRDALAEHEDPAPVDAWVPLGLAHRLTGMSGASDRVGAIIWGVGRLKTSVTVAQANADLAAIAGRLARAYPATDAGYGLVARPVRDQLLGEFYQPVWILAGGSALMLLIGCANAATLYTGRLVARRREMAVRGALGATRSRLVTQTLVETLAIAIVAGALGTGAALAGIDALNRWTAEHLPGLVPAAIDVRLLVGAVALSLATGVLVGLVPAMSVHRDDLRQALGDGGRQGSSRGGRTPVRLLVGAEVALATALLVGGGLLVKSLYRLTNIDLGFDTANLLTVRLDLRAAAYATPDARARFGAALVEGARAIPGVRSATLWGPSMLGRATWVMDAVREGLSADDPRNVLTFERHSVNPGGLANLGIRLLAGRDFSSHDTTSTARVAIISAGLAATWWPGQDPIGKRFMRPTDRTPITVIGVAADARHRERFALADAALGIPPAGLGPQRDAYFPFAQLPPTAVVVALRTTLDPSAIAQSFRRVVASLDPALPTYDAALLDSRLADQERGSRALALLTASYAVLSVLLAAFGLFGVLAHAVRGRTQEIGIRMALGQSARSIRGLVLREGLRLTGAGLAAGLLGAALLARTMQSLLFGVSVLDGEVYACICVLLVAAALLACWLPARRATRVDPLVALKYE